MANKRRRDETPSLPTDTWFSIAPFIRWNDLLCTLYVSRGVQKQIITCLSNPDIFDSIHDDIIKANIGNFTAPERNQHVQLFTVLTRIFHLHGCRFPFNPKSVVDWVCHKRIFDNDKVPATEELLGRLLTDTRCRTSTIETVFNHAVECRYYNLVLSTVHHVDAKTINDALIDEICSKGDPKIIIPLMQDQRADPGK
jgi:hypothetical protein